MFYCLGLVSESPQLDLSNLYCRKYTNSGVYMTKQAYELYFFLKTHPSIRNFSSIDVCTLPIFPHGIWIILGYMNRPSVGCIAQATLSQDSKSYPIYGNSQILQVLPRVFPVYMQSYQRRSQDYQLATYIHVYTFQSFIYLYSG